MKKPLNIVFLDASTLNYGNVNTGPLKKLGNLISYDQTTPSQLKSRIKNADIIITNKVVLNESNLDLSPNLKLICLAATGYNNVDVEAAKKRGIAVVNAVGYCTDAVAEHALMFLLGLSRRFVEHHEAVMNKEWSRSRIFNVTDYPFSNLGNTTLGIVGYGAIGKKLTKLAKGLGMRVLVSKIPGKKYKDKTKRHALKTVIMKSDFLSLHCPLSPLTLHLINHDTLALMKPSAYLLNLARGPIVDETAVAIALLDNKIKGYATDVMEHEPPSKDHPFLDRKLRGKVFITPHVAWASVESRQNLINEIGINIQAFLKGKKRNRVA